MKISVSLVCLLSALGMTRAALAPRASPTPCTQRYVCPTPLPYPGTPGTGDNPGPDRFKCRIGQSRSDPNFAFCIYEKNTGTLVASTPSGIVSLCWNSGMANPQCASPPGRRALPTRLLSGANQPVPGDKVVMRRFPQS
ncbi:hypothetical protein BKA70DRAFT_1194429 [Coprinopsis sp. MPI-PUGE-AT-0042]|nr:hypothetical protein BKA70DRAFT_1194429 [Coprinopsis sp. MPI-PUGE-AT-0042]